MNRRGLTLVELMVAVGILGIVLTAAFQALLGFREVAELGNLRRATGANVRQAVQFIERDLRLAGYGIEPAIAFDFSVYGGGGAYCGGGPGSGVDGANQCPQQRDRIDGPDELVFYARNPGYWGGDLGADPEGRAWSVNTADASTVTLAAHGGEYFGRGQIIQLVCSGGTASAYVRVAQSTQIGGAGPVAIPIEPELAGDPFTQNPEPFIGVCGGRARAFAVDRFRYFVDPAVVLANGTTASFLMLDTGVDRTHDGVLDAKDLVPVANGIVDLQVSYLRPEPGLVEVGATTGAPIVWCNEAARPVTGPVACAGGLRVVQFNAGAGAGDYRSYSYLVPAGGAGIRLGPDAGNISAVRIALVARGNRTQAVSQTHPLLLNRSTLPPSERNQAAVYATTEISVPTPNLLSRGLTYL